MKTARIFLDMDGVIVDFDKFRIAGNLTGDQVKALPGAYKIMEPMAGAVAGVRSLIGMGFEVWLATKPPTGIAFAYGDKAAWALEHLPELKRRIIITHDKGLLGCESDYLVDDRPHKANCEKFPGMLVRFGTQVKNWEELLNFFRGREPMSKDNEASVPATVAREPETATMNLEIERETDGRWIAEWTNYPGCMAYGATRGEAVRKATDLLFEVAGKQHGAPSVEPAVEERVDAEREAFHRYIVGHLGSDMWVRRNEQGSYLQDTIEVRWLAWAARASSGTPKIPDHNTCDDCKKPLTHWIDGPGQVVCNSCYEKYGAGDALGVDAAPAVAGRTQGDDFCPLCKKSDRFMRHPGSCPNPFHDESSRFDLDWELQYIADSPSPEHGGFHPRVVKAAQEAINALAALRESAKEKKI